MEPMPYARNKEVRLCLLKLSGESACWTCHRGIVFNGHVFAPPVSLFLLPLPNPMLFEQTTGCGFHNITATITGHERISNHLAPAQMSASYCFRCDCIAYVLELFS